MSRPWADAVSSLRPFSDEEALYRAAAQCLDALDWSSVLDVLTSHPKIDARLAATDGEAAWSRDEQAGIAGSDQGVVADIAAVNAAYEATFGYVFLVRAEGRRAGEILDDAVARLGHDYVTERSVVRGELGEIVRLRLGRMLEELSVGALR
jgi:2-oxo-4-hydroxy-4-carboxy-5-ureidoimidazoline decarboxylase